MLKTFASRSVPHNRRRRLHKTRELLRAVNRSAYIFHSNIASFWILSLMFMTKIHMTSFQRIAQTFKNYPPDIVIGF